jgi:hypothetical protein
VDVGDRAELQARGDRGLPGHDDALSLAGASTVTVGSEHDVHRVGSRRRDHLSGHRGQLASVRTVEDHIAAGGDRRGGNRRYRGLSGGAVREADRIRPPRGDPAGWLDQDDVVVGWIVG